MTTPFPLGRIKQHDPRSRNYAYRRHLPIKSKQWNSNISVLDQGNLGSCTGNAAVGCLGYGPFFQTVIPSDLDQDLAVSVYSEATTIDEWEGSYPPDDTGSSGLAVSKVLKRREYISGYRWMFSFVDVLGALMESPLIIGTYWYDEMFYPDSYGAIRPEGGLAGGHEYILDGYDDFTGFLHFRNSWGPDWGKGGGFYMQAKAFEGLLADGGDAVIFSPLTQPAPEPTPPTPEPEPPGCLRFIRVF